MKDTKTQTKPSSHVLWLKAGLGRLGELFLSVALVLVVFLGLATLLNFMFPLGVRIQELGAAEGPDRVGSSPTSVNRNLLIDQGSADLAFALLTDKENEVKLRGSDQIAWITAKKGMRLQNQDAVQTYKRASALISLDEENTISLDENTLLIVRSVEKNLLDSFKRSYMLIVDGQLKGRMSGSGKRVELTLQTPSGTAQIRPNETPGENTEFAVRITDDKSSVFTVEKGDLEVSAKGKRVQVRANQFTRVGPSGVPSRPRSLPKPPAPLVPKGGSRFRFRELAPQVTFRWAPGQEMDRYRFVISRDKTFRKPLHEEQLSGEEFTFGNLKPGRYYWRVSRIRDDVEGRGSKTRSLDLVMDGVPPSLSVVFPTRPVRETSVILTGKTDPGVQIFVNDREVPTNGSGSFELQAELHAGVNLIVVEAVDNVGNLTYQSEYVNCKP